MIFENPQVDSGQLPQIKEIVYQKLAPAFKSSEYVANTIFFLFLLVVALVFFYKSANWLGVYRYGLLIAWAAYFIISIALVGRQYEVAGYALRDHDVVFRFGVWWHVETAIPFNRMQHCEISRGPVQNAFGLATIRIFTAGGHNSDLLIEGLEREEAGRIKDFITAKIAGRDLATAGAQTPESENLGTWEMAGETPPSTVTFHTATETAHRTENPEHPSTNAGHDPIR